MPPPGVTVVVLCPRSRNGESILVQTGGRWIIVDSFSLTSPGGKPAAQVYLEEHYGDAWHSVVDFIVLSHYHSDHILGIDTLVKKCASAKYLPPAPGAKQLRDMYSPEESKLERKASIQAMNALSFSSGRLQPLQQRENPFFVGDAQIEILGPRNAHRSNAVAARSTTNKPNARSTVLRVTDDSGCTFVLGGDLEGRAEWKRITTEDRAVDRAQHRLGNLNMVSLFKLSHHATHNAYDKQQFLGPPITCVFAPNNFLKINVEANGNQALKWEGPMSGTIKDLLSSGHTIYAAMEDHIVVERPTQKQGITENQHQRCDPLNMPQNKEIIYGVVSSWNGIAWSTTKWESHS
jgi:beta-lactamase superfamily II metal-dependent hydrolase